LARVVPTAVQEECDAKVKAECSSIPCAVKIDWEFCDHDTFVNDWAYVQYCRDIACIPKRIYMGAENQHYPSLHNFLQGQGSGLSSNLYNLSDGLYLCPDMANDTYSRVGKSEHLFPRDFICTAVGTTRANLYINSKHRTNVSALDGCGISVEFGLDKASAMQREEERIQHLAAQAMAREEERREQRMREWERDCESTARDNERAISDHERKCNQIDKENEDPCTWCKGSLTRNCDKCGGRGTEFKRACSKCHGSGSMKCSSCCNFGHPGKKHKRRSHPRRPSPKSNPSRPSFVPINSIDWRAGI